MPEETKAKTTPWRGWHKFCQANMSQWDQLRTVALSEINARFSCPLCKGYIIDCVTAEECGHAYCRSCVARHIANGTVTCPEPSCRKLINREEPGEPFQKLKSDSVLQRLIYKLVPNLVSNETERRAQYHGSEKVARKEVKESVGDDALFFNDRSCVCIELKPRLGAFQIQDEKNSDKSTFFRMELGSPLSILADFVKLQTGTTFKVSLSSSPKAPVLDHDLRLIDLAYLIAWDMTRPLPVYYELIDTNNQPAGRLQPLTPLLRTESNPRSPDKPANNRMQTSSSVLVMAQARPDYAAAAKQASQPAQSAQTSPTVSSSKLKLILNKNDVGNWQSISPPAISASPAVAPTFNFSSSNNNANRPTVVRLMCGSVSDAARSSGKHGQTERRPSKTPELQPAKRPFDRTRDPVFVPKVAKVLPFPAYSSTRADDTSSYQPPIKKFCDAYQFDSESEILKSTGLVPFAKAPSGKNVMTYRHILHGHRC